MNTCTCTSIKSLKSFVLCTFESLLKYISIRCIGLYPSLQNRKEDGYRKKCPHACMYCFVCHIVLPTYPSLDHSPLAIEGRFPNFVYTEEACRCLHAHFTVVLTFFQCVELFVAGTARILCIFQSQHVHIVFQHISCVCCLQTFGA